MTLDDPSIHLRPLMLDIGMSQPTDYLSIHAANSDKGHKLRKKQ